MKAINPEFLKPPASADQGTPSRRRRRHGALQCWSTALFVCFLGILVSGCATTPIDPGVTGPFHEVGNYHLADRKMPQSVRRVAVLPLTSSENDQAARSGRESLHTILYSELIHLISRAIQDKRGARWAGRRMGPLAEVTKRGE